MNIIWKIFFLAISAVVLMIGGRFCYTLYQYVSFDAVVPATVQHWKVIETGPSEFQVSAEYTYFLKEKHTAAYLFKGPRYSNSFVAHQHLRDLENHSWSAFVNSSRPSESTLQHNFPFKGLIHCVLGVGVLLYFLWLKNYVTSRFALDA